MTNLEKQEHEEIFPITDIRTSWLMFLWWEWYMVTLIFLNTAFLEGSKSALGKAWCHTVFLTSNAQCCFLWTQLWPLLLQLETSPIPWAFSCSSLYPSQSLFCMMWERWHLCLCKPFRLVLYISLSVLQVCLAHDLFLKVSCSIS